MTPAGFTISMSLTYGTGARAPYFSNTGHGGTMGQTRNWPKSTAHHASSPKWL